jgi:hypothetical protein
MPIFTVVVAVGGGARSSSAGTLLARLDAAERAELLRLLRAVAGERQDDARAGDRPADGAGEPRGAHG